MSKRVEELFSGGEAAQRPARSGWIKALLAAAIPLDVLGILSCTSVPGAALTLAAWWLVDRELALLESGVIAVESAPALGRLKQLTLGALTFCGVSLFVQIVLLSTGFYERWLLRLSQWLQWVS